MNTAHDIKPGKRCDWTEDEDGSWDTGCEKKYQFINGGPRENGQKFCGYCGGALKVKKS